MHTREPSCKVVAAGAVAAVAVLAAEGAGAKSTTDPEAGADAGMADCGRIRVRGLPHARTTAVTSEHSVRAAEPRLVSSRRMQPARKSFICR
jgi:hypothetical protein